MNRTVMLAAFLLTAGTVGAQDPAPEPPGPKVGEEAPDFTVRGATRYGVLAEPFRLSDNREKTVVLAFFTQARTRG